MFKIFNSAKSKDRLYLNLIASSFISVNDAESIELLEKAIKIRPDRAEAYNNLIIRLNCLRKYNEAFFFLKTIFDKHLVESKDINIASTYLSVLLSQDQQEHLMATIIKDLATVSVVEKQSIMSLLISDLSVNSRVDKLYRIVDLIMRCGIVGYINDQELNDYLCVMVDPLCTWAGIFLKKNTLLEATELIKLAVELPKFQNETFKELHGILGEFFEGKSSKEIPGYIFEELIKAEKEQQRLKQISSEDELLRFLFQRLARRFHPDMNPKDDQIMIEINNAYNNKDLNRLKQIAKTKLHWDL